MGFLKNVRDIYRQQLSIQTHPHNPQRTLQQSDYDDWAEALRIRDRRGKRELKTMQDARRAVSLKNPRRWGNLEREFKWAQKEMAKMGLNPEDLRFML